jgi:hypothetical protein
MRSSTEPMAFFQTSLQLLKILPYDVWSELRRNKTFSYYPSITHYWTVPLILDHSYLVGKLTGWKIADTSVKISEVLKLLFQQFLN